MSVATGAEPRTGDRPGPHPLGGWTWLLVAAVLVPLVAGAVHLLTAAHGYHAVNDDALNELVVRAMPGRLPLVGPYARDAWAHPGPLVYYLLWPLYRLFGSTSAAFAVGAAVLNGAAITGTVLLARRWGGWAFAIPVTIVVALVLVRLPHGYPVNPWNPALTVLPFGAFVLLAWAAICGDRWALPVAAAVGTFCVQTHVGYLLLVVPLLLWAVVRLWWRYRRTPDRRAHVWVPLAWTASVLAVLWAPPVIQEITHSQGNLREAFHYFRTSTDPGHSIVDGWRVVMSQFTVTADWIRGARPVTTVDTPSLHASPIPLLLVAFVVAAWFAWRRWPALRELAVVLGLAIILGVVAVARTLGPVYDYRLRWVWVLAGFTTAFVVAVIARGLAARVGAGAATAAIAVGTVVIVALVAIATVHLARYEPHRLEALRTDALARGIERTFRHRSDVVVLRPGSYGGYIAMAGTVLRLEEDGIPVEVGENTDQTRLTFGPQRIHHGRAPRKVVVLATGSSIADVARLPGARRIAFASGAIGRPAGDRNRAAVRDDDLAAFLVAPDAQLPRSPVRRS